jgi:hypothetical protein
MKCVEFRRWLLWVIRDASPGLDGGTVPEEDKKQPSKLWFP